MRAKMDLKKAEPDLYHAPRGRSVVVDVPEGLFLMVDGHGGPASSPDFQPAIGALYALAYDLKLKLRAKGEDHVILPLEGLWWWPGADMRVAPERDWRWTLLLRVPDAVTPALFSQAVKDAHAKRPNPALARVRLERFREGRCMQTMHVGPYATEMDTIARLHDDVRKAGYVMAGKHHEVYLGDPRRSRPERLRTILRQPVRWSDDAQA